jgi:hypothetical protein
MLYSIYRRGWVLDQYQKLPSSKASNVPSNTWFVAVFLDRFPAVCVAECFKLSSLQWWMKIFYYDWSWSVAGIQVSCSQAPNMKLESFKAVTRDFRRNHCNQCQSILHYPIPDYNKIPPKVDAWRRTSKVGFEDKLVSGLVQI